MEGRNYTRSPAVKRLMREAQALSEQTDQYFAQPIEDNLFEWHFTVREQSITDYQNGIYHGRLIIPVDYPTKPPSIIWLAPNGQFETNKKINLSISGYQQNTWQPSWSIRKILLAIIGSISTQSAGALEYKSQEYKALTARHGLMCPVCGDISVILLESGAESSHLSQEAMDLATQIKFQVEVPEDIKNQCTVKSPGINWLRSTTELDFQGTSESSVNFTKMGSPECQQPVQQQRNQHSTNPFSSWIQPAVVTPDISTSSSPIFPSVTHPPWSSNTMSDGGTNCSTTSCVPRFTHLSSRHTYSKPVDPPERVLSSEAKALPSTWLQPLTASCSGCSLVSANNSSALLSNVQDELYQQSPTAISVPDVSLIHPPPSSSSPTNNPAKLNMLAELLIRVTRITSTEHTQHTIIHASQRQVTDSETSNAHLSSDVDGSADVVDKSSSTFIQFEFCDTKADKSASTKYIPISSSVDNGTALYSSDKMISKIKSKWVEPEPRSSPVDAVVLTHQKQLESEVKSTAAVAAQGADVQKNAVVHAPIPFTKVLETPVVEALTCAIGSPVAVVHAPIPFTKVLETPVVETLTCAVGSQGAVFHAPIPFTKVLETPIVETLTCSAGFHGAVQEINNTSSRKVQKNIQIIQEIMENKVGINSSDTSISLLRKESLSEQTGMEISHSELPADLETSESGIPVLDMSDTEQRSSFEKSTNGSVPELEKRQKPLKSLRQRQSAPARVPSDITENDQISSDQISSVGSIQRIEAVAGDAPHRNQQQFRHHGLRMILEQQHARVNEAHVTMTTRPGQIQSLYSASFMVMVGLCLTTLVILINRVYFDLDVADLFNFEARNNNNI